MEDIPIRKRKIESETIIKEITGDLFSSKESLAHCISKDLKLGKGIAKTFREKYPDLISELKLHDPQIGDLLIYKDKSRFIYNLITKLKYWQFPTYDNLKTSLISMRDHAKSNNVKEISMPQIGCGLDKLVWSNVKDILEEVFSGSGIVINVYRLK